ncbi:MAG: hypothetical protein ACXWCV_06640, partial [Caldimonas sp.]
MKNGPEGPSFVLPPLNAAPGRVVLLRRVGDGLRSFASRNGLLRLDVGLGLRLALGAGLVRTGGDATCLHLGGFASGLERA